jgi:hypothetical protein
MTVRSGIGARTSASTDRTPARCRRGRGDRRVGGGERLRAHDHHPNRGRSLRGPPLGEVRTADNDRTGGLPRHPPPEVPVQWVDIGPIWLALDAVRADDAEPAQRRASAEGLDCIRDHLERPRQPSAVAPFAQRVDVENRRSGGSRRASIELPHAAVIEPHSTNRKRRQPDQDLAATGFDEGDERIPTPPGPGGSGEVP